MSSSSLAVDEIQVAEQPNRRRRYPEYVSTGVAWLAQIPKGWHIKRLRYMVSFPNKGEIRGLSADQPVSFVPMEAVGEYGGLKLDAVRPISDVLNGYTYFRNGDVLVAKITPCFENGKGALAEDLEGGIAFGTTELHVLRGGRELCSRYLFYLTLGEHFRKLGASEMYGAGGQKRVPERFIKDLCHPIPPLVEQWAIAAFLDRETAKIDELIAKKDELVTNLKILRGIATSRIVQGLDTSSDLRHSNIPWAALLPAHWAQEPAKRLFRQVIVPPQQDDKIVTAFRDGEVTFRDNRRAEGFMIALQEVGYQRVRAGQLVVHSMDGFAGAIGVSDSTGKCTPEYMVLEPTRLDVIPEYFGLCLREMALRGFIEVECKAVRERAPRLRFSTFKDFVLPLPPPHEQKRIAHKIVETQNASRAKEQLLQKSVESLRELRSALISAAVTGQIDVRHYREEIPCP